MGFIVCAGCQRHVKCGDATCPFCGASVSCATKAGNPSQTGARTRRGLLFGAVAGMVASGTSVASCSSTALYGAPCANEDCTFPENDAAADGAAVPFYGGAPVDSGRPNDARAVANDADATEDAPSDAADDG